jgi:hypothetical protein
MGDEIYIFLFLLIGTLALIVLFTFIGRIFLIKGYNRLTVILLSTIYLIVAVLFSAFIFAAYAQITGNLVAIFFGLLYLVKEKSLCTIKLQYLLSHYF